MKYLTFCDAYFYWRKLRNDGLLTCTFGDWLTAQDHKGKPGLYGVWERA